MVKRASHRPWNSHRGYGGRWAFLLPCHTLGLVRKGVDWPRAIHRRSYDRYNGILQHNQYRFGPGKISGRWRSTLPHPEHCLAYNVYRTKDDKYISLGNVERRFWANFCRVVGREDLVHKQYYVYQDGEETTETLKDLFLSRTLSEWLQRFADVNHCFAPVNTPEEAIRDPNLVARGIIKKVKDAKRSEIIIFGFPALFSGGLVCSRRPAPGLGIHTSQMLKEIGCSPGEIKQLKKEGVI